MDGSLGGNCGGERRERDPEDGSCLETRRKKDGEEETKTTEVITEEKEFVRSSGSRPSVAFLLILSILS